MEKIISLTFFGGVVGDLSKSSVLLAIEERNGRMTKILVDYGLWQGNKREFYERNMNIFFNPASIDAVVLTHSHVDHLGGVPILYNSGLGYKKKEGMVYCTKPTYAIAPTMLFDTAKIAEREFLKKVHKRIDDKKVIKKVHEELKNGNGRSKIIEKLNLGWAVEPYTSEDVTKCLWLFNNGGHDYKKWIKIARGVNLKFLQSAHVLGGAICELEIEKDSSKKRTLKIGFSGDLGRRDNLILPPPDEIEEPLDYWVTESTYGGIEHPSREDEIEYLKKAVLECYTNNGKIMIPSFALERAQEMIYVLSYLMFKKELPRINIYLDSPMAEEITTIFSRYWKTHYFKNQYKLNFNPFDPESNKFFKIIVNYHDSEDLVNKKEQNIVIAGSGMGDAGRIRSHYKKSISSPRNSVFIIGHMVQGTLNRNLIDGQDIVMIDGKEYEVKAKTIKFGSFSAHADRKELIARCANVVNSNLKNIFIGHGGEKNGLDLKWSLDSELKGKWKGKTIIPKLYQKFAL